MAKAILVLRKGRAKTDDAICVIDLYYHIIDLCGGMLSVWLIKPHKYIVTLILRSLCFEDAIMAMESINKKLQFRVVIGALRKENDYGANYKNFRIVRINRD